MISFEQQVKTMLKEKNGTIENILVIISLEKNSRITTRCTIHQSIDFPFQSHCPRTHLLNINDNKWY